MSPAAAGSPRWDPEVLERIASLELRSRELVDGLLHGHHQSRRVTSNVEFADYKEYSPGDPLRDLDWRVFARRDRLVVRRHRAETELAVTIVLDASGDLATGAGSGYPRAGRRPPLDGTKWGYAVVLAATLTHWLARRGEPVGLAVLGGDSVRWRWLGPGTGPAHTARLYGVLAETIPAGRADLRQGLRDVGARVRRRSMVIVISDLMEPPDDWGPSLDAFGMRRTDVRLVHLYDEAEWRFDVEGPARYLSPEGGAPVPADERDVRAHMEEVVAAYLREVRRWLGRNRAWHILAPTGQPMEAAVAALLRGM